MKPLLRHLATAVAIFFAAAAAGQDTEATNGPGSSGALGPLTTGTNSIPLLPVLPVVLAKLPQQDVFNEVVPPLLNSIVTRYQTNGLVRFINDWHLRPVVFHVNNGASQDEVLGLQYRYEQSVANRVMLGSTLHPVGVSFTLQASGNLAANASKNPNNLLESGVSLHLFQGLGGINPHYRPAPEAQQALQNLVKASTTNAAAYDQAVKQFTACMAPQFFWDLQGHATLESDQQFINKQWSYGGVLSLVYRDWRPRSKVGWFNLPDYPFATVRWLVGHEEFQPSGRTFPSMVFGLDLVDPSSDGARLAIDPDKEPYPRTRVELAFKTPVLKWRKQNLYFSAAYRYFQELGAPSAIEAAHLDHSHYFVAMMDLPYKFNFSYSTGKLPLDRRNDQVYALGWALNF